MKLIRHLMIATVTAASLISTAYAAPTLQFAVGMYQPTKDKNDATYTPLANYLSKKLGVPVKLRTVESWEGLAKSLANGETDVALMGPWGYVLANNEAKAQAVATIEYEGKPIYYGIMITHPGSGINSPADLKGKTFAFADKGSTSGYLIPFYYFQKQGINPDTYFSKVIYTEHPAIEAQVTKGAIDAGADYNRNRDTMIADGLIKASDSKIIWKSDPLPNDAVAVSEKLYKDKAFVAKLQSALEDLKTELKSQPELLPPRYTGFVKSDNSYYKPIRDAGLATGRLQPK